MDWDEFETRVKMVIPSQELKPKRCWIGVLSHEKTPHEPLQEADFVWMIGHTKITMQKVHEVYQKRHEGVRFQLKFRDDVVDTNDTIKSFLATNGVLALFLACSSAGSRFPTPLAACRPDSVTGELSIDSAAQAGAPRTTTPASVGRVEEPRDNDTSFTPTESSSLLITPNLTLNETDAGPTSAAPQDGDGSTCKEWILWRPQEQAIHLINPPQISGVSNVELQPEHDPLDICGLANLEPPYQEPSAAPRMPHVTQDNIPMPNYLPVNTQRRSPPLVPHMEQETLASFDAETFFSREISPEQHSQEMTHLTDQSIREIMAQHDPAMLEAGVSQAIEVLRNLQSTFSKYAGSSQDANAWNEAVDKLIPQAQCKPTIVGVVGNTGAGKSSVINAMLDEERLVPTNCMRACTAVVTEISWNDSTDPRSKYRAEIEFIRRDDWEKELETLLKEFLTETGSVSRDIADPNSDAGIAWAKFHSVYPKVTRDSLSDCTVENLMAERAILDVFGTTKKINTSSPTAFYSQLQKYVDSKEKVAKDKQKKAFDMEYWPLIRVVKIYVKAPALSSGAVIVDLPGVHDSNAARAAVAQGYMKQCTGLWIVAPINRAVDDKAAKTLLGDSFKRQLKYDGGFASVTFICSKTDDISVTEAIDTLDLEDEVEVLYDQQRQFEQEIEDVKKKIEGLTEAKQVYRQAQSKAANDIEIWEDLQERLDEGNIVYAPTSRGNKRKKAQAKSKDACKRWQRGRHDFDDDFIASDREDLSAGSEGCSDDEGVQAPRRPLIEEDIRSKIKELRESRKIARREGLEYNRKMEELRPRMQELENNIAAIKTDISHICIVGRNEYSARAIQLDFAAGIKELDQENAAEENEETFNPDEELRDYEQVAKSLPVFCVSSRAYQKMSGRLKKDDDVPGFKQPEDTGLPQLQAHCTKLTEAGRSQTARMFLLSVCQQLATFSLWASNDGAGLKMTEDDKSKQVRYLEKCLSELERGLEEAVRLCLNFMKKEMNDQIFTRYPDLINEAIVAAPDTAQKWGAHKSDGGLTWMTYKAVVRRDGVYQSAVAGHRDFNADLVNPIVKKLATGWERAFQNRVPKAFDAFVRDSGRLLHNFHMAVEERARKNGVGLASLGALKNQIHTYEQLFANLNQILVTKMTELQREANRDFTPTIANIMHTVYDTCAKECGTGSFARMKKHMSEHVDQNRQDMFHNATKTVKQHLDDMCKQLEDVMDSHADEIFVKMKSDYMLVLGGVQINQKAMMPKEERTLRSDIMDIIRSVDAQFEPIARGKLSQLEDVASTSEEPMAVNYNDSVLESASGSAYRDKNGDSFMENADDTTITEPATAKAAEGSSDKENRSLRAPSDDGMDDEEL